MATRKRSLRGYRTIILALVGAVLAIFGALWIAVIFPSLDKVPSDFEATCTFDGSFMLPDPATQSLVTIPISQTLEQQGIGTKDGALLVHEVRTVRNAITGEVLSPMYNDESILAIDAHTLKFMPDVDERQRTGYFSPPKGLGEGDSFDLWHPGAGRPLTATYASSEEFRGLDVVVFKIEEQNLSIGKDPMSGMDLFFTTVVRLWIEPSTGTVVNQESTTTTSIDMMGTMMPVQIANVDLSEQSIVDLVEIAKSASLMLLWFKTLIPLISIGFGAILVIGSGVILIVRNVQKSRVDKQNQFPKPTSQPTKI